MFLFSADKNNFALELNKVSEVAELREIVSVPGGIDYLTGAMSYKGELYLIVDLASFFSSGKTNTHDINVIIVDDDDYKIGFLTEKIVGAVDAQEECPSDDEFIKRQCKYNDSSVKLIDCEEIFLAIEKDIDSKNLRQV